MTTKKLVLLAGVALALVAAACLLKGGKRNAAPSLNGKKMLPDFAVADVARIEIGDSLALAAGPEGWRIETMQNYPADATRIVENLLALGELKVGQVARGRELREKTPVVLRDASGAELASVTLGERHERWGFGRYAAFKGETVLVTDMLDAFGSDPMRWCDAKIVDEPYIRFNALADAALADDATGLATGIVRTVTIAGDTNRVATIGAAVPGGTDRYLRLDNSAWTYIVPAYSVEKLLPKEEEPKTEETNTESLPLADFPSFSVDSAAPFTLRTDEGRTLAFEAPEVLEIDEERTAPANREAAWSDLEVWPSDGKGKGAWSLFPRYDEDGSIILGGAFRQLVPGSVKITSADGATTFQEGTDYRVNQEWGFVANVENRLGEPGAATLRFQAKLALQRIDLVQKDAEGRLSVKKGESRRISPMIPAPDAGCTAVAGVYLAPWQRDGAWKILPEDIFPIDAEKAKPVELVRPEAVAKTLEKLREGKPVTIAFIGDSLTLGAEAGQWWSDDSTTWRGRVMRGLKARFPKSEITELPAFQGGRGIAFGLEVVKETVLPAKPDLAFVMLGVNDCHKGISAPGPTTPVDAFRKGFDSLIAQCQESGMDVVVLSSMETNPFDANGDAARWADYRAAIRAVSDARGTAYGDTYEQWQRLRYRGIPPFSQLHNWINHPGSWGHGLFADVALRFFPE